MSETDSEVVAALIEDANCGIVGIDANGIVFGGYDGRLIDPLGCPRWQDQPISDEVRAELARVMIERWRRFGEGG